jgi:hypothetical protein
MNFIVINQESFQTHSAGHSINTSYKYHHYREVAKSSCCDESTHCAAKVHTVLWKYTLCYKSIHCAVKVHTVLRKYTLCYECTHCAAKVQTVL